MTEWQNDRMTEWQHDSMTAWQNDRMTQIIQITQITQMTWMTRMTWMIQITWMIWMTQMTRMTWMTQMTQMTGWQKASQTIDRMVYLTDKDSGLPQVYLCPRWCCSRPWSYTARRPLSTTMGLRGVWPGTARRHPKLGAGAGGPVRIRLPRCSVTLLFITTLPWPWLMFPEKQIIPTASVIFAVSYWSVATACYLGYLWRHLQSILNKCSKQVCLTLGSSSVAFA